HLVCGVVTVGPCVGAGVCAELKDGAGHRWGLSGMSKSRPGLGRLVCVCFVPPRPFEGHAHVHVAGAASVTGWGHGGGRYSQLLRVGSSSLKRGLIEALLSGRLIPLLL